MTMKRIVTLALFLLLLSCLNPPESELNTAPFTSTEELERFHALEIESEAISMNRIGEPSLRRHYIYLPADYQDSEERYPVVFYCHGYTSSPSVLRHMQYTIDRWCSEHPETTFIMVAIDARNQYGGSFYNNSPITGNWETHIIKELLPRINEDYRTIENRDSRIITGMSMGGYGALYLGMKYPELFSAVASVSPGAFDPQGLYDAMHDGRWDSDFHRAYGSVFSPREGDLEIFYNVPKFDGSPEDDEIIKDWESGFGDLEKKVNEYSQLEYQLDALRLIYGDQDQYTWIPRGTEYLSQTLDKYSIEHEIINHHGDHSIDNALLEEYILPFIDEVFQNH